ncbi:MAG: hypothetical protein HKL98_04250 [Burkholderiales bacterium]|nr:hypothetical protein [Burkholderiales bacterium]
MNPVKFEIPLRYKVLFVFLTWGALLLFFFIRYDSYGIDENAARALMFVWSIVDGVAHPVVVLGAPDFRALLFIPIGLMWTGNIAAAKILTLLVMAASSLLLYDWADRTLGRESALIATGLLLVSPLAITQIDSLGAGPYLLLATGLGFWLDRTYRAEPRPLGGWYFSQIFLIGLSVSLHPAGLAYPISLAWHWYRNPVDVRQQRHYYFGIAAMTIFVLLIRMGWSDLPWLQNPIRIFAMLVTGPIDLISTAGWMTGAVIAAILLFTLFKSPSRTFGNLGGRTLALGVVLGSLSADFSWAMLVLAFLLYVGIARIIEIHDSIPGEGFLVKRGGVFFLIFVLATAFMLNNRGDYEYRKIFPLSEEDKLLGAVALVARSEQNKHILVASQWPGKTMITCQCDVLPLPSPAKDPATQLAMLKGINYMVFNPRDPKNEILSRNLALLGEQTETVALRGSGVVIRIR